MASKILFISPVPLFPSHAGNRIRMHNICAELMQMGYQIDFFYTGFNENLDDEHYNFFNGEILDHQVKNVTLTWQKRVREILNGMQIKAHKKYRSIVDGEESASYNKSPGEYRNFRKMNLLQQQTTGQKYAAVIVNYAVYTFYFDFFDSDIVKIVDTHDRLTNRYKLFLSNGEEPVDWYSLRPSDEKKLLETADVIWAITEKEKEHYQALMPDGKQNVKVLKHLIRYDEIAVETSSNAILMIGSDNQLNIDGLKWFLGNVWPGIRNNLLDAELLVAGAICDRQDLFKTEEVRFLGRYDDERDVYSKAGICINPMQQGTGLKIKSLEALAYGKVVVTTREGASGLTYFQDHGLFCEDSPLAWIKILTELLTDNDQRESYRKKIEKRVNALLDQNISVIKESINFEKKMN